MKDFEHRRTFGFSKKNMFDLKEQEIVIEDNVWIGYNASIHKGVTIGKGAIIGSDILVTKNVPQFAIVIGSPGKIVGYTD